MRDDKRILLWSFDCALGCASLAFAAGRYPLRISPDHRHLIDQSGAPFLILGDAPWSLISGLTKEEAEVYLEGRRRQGFNSIIVNLIEHKFHGPVNRYGEGPFTTPGDFSTPNEKYFEHADWVIRRAARRASRLFWRRSTWAISGPTKDGSRSLWPTVRKNARNWGATSAIGIATSTTSSG